MELFKQDRFHSFIKLPPLIKGFSLHYLMKKMTNLYIIFHRLISLYVIILTN